MTPQLLEIEFYFVPDNLVGAIVRPLIAYQGNYQTAFIDWLMQKIGKVAYHRNIGLFSYYEDAIEAKAEEKTDRQILDVLKVLPPQHQLICKFSWANRKHWFRPNIHKIVKKYQTNEQIQGVYK